MLETVSGRKLKLNPDKISSTLALNYPVQGGGADLIKWAAVRFVRSIKQIKGQPALVNMVHDELLVEVDLEAAEEVRQLWLSRWSAQAPISSLRYRWRLMRGSVRRGSTKS